MYDQNLPANCRSRWMMKLLLAALTAAILSIPAWAQTPQLVSSVAITINPSRTAEFMEIQKRFTEAHKKGGGAWRGVWRNVNNLSEFVIVSPVENYAAFDSPGAVNKGMSEVEFAQLVSRYAHCLRSRDRTLRTVLSELSIPPTKVPKMVYTITAKVRPGKFQEFESLLGEILVGYKKVGLPAYGVHRVRYGGSPATYMTWRPMEKMAELDGPAWAQKALQSLGEGAAQKWMERYGAAVESAEHDIYAYQEDLSYYPEQ